MSYGYNARLVSQNRQADRSLLGVQLGRLCIRQDIPVSRVSEHLGVSRQTIYNWFRGVSAPQQTLVDLVKAYMRSISQ
jgi:DNA-binding transcriptional regulator YiaG